MYQTPQFYHSNIIDTCAGKDCRNEGKHLLRIIYLNKVGWFCDDCKDLLLKNKLVIDRDDD